MNKTNTKILTNFGKKFMKPAILLLLLAFLACSEAAGQDENVGIGTTTPDNSALLDLDVSSMLTKRGFLAPRMTAAEIAGIASPATGLLVYQTDGNAGFYFYDGSGWVQFLSANDGPYLALAGGTMDGDIDMNSNNILNIGNMNASGTITFSGLAADRFVKTEAGGVLTTGSLALSDLPLNQGTILVGDASNEAAEFTLNSTEFLLGDGSNQAAAVTMGGDATLANDGTLTLANSGASAGTYGDATNVSQVTVDAKGRVSSIGEVAISGVSPVSSSLTSGNFWVGDGTNLAAEVSLGGDATLANDGTLTLANSGASAGTYGDATNVSQVTVDAKGRVTTIGEVAISGVSPVSSSLTSGNFWVGDGTNLAAEVSMGGDATLANDGTLTLANSGASAGTYGDASKVAQVTVDAKGRVTSISDVALSGVSPVSSSLTSGSLWVGDGTNLAAEVSMGGDATLANDGTLTLANSGASAGTYGDATNVSQVTVDAKGRVTSIGEVAISGVSPVSSSLTNSYIWVGNSSGLAAEAELIGDITLFNDGNVTVDGIQTRDVSANAPADGQAYLWNAGATEWQPGDVATVTSVGLSLPAEYAVSGSPVTTNGTISATWTSQNQNLVFASPDGAAGTPSFRALTADDMPAGTLTGSGSSDRITFWTGGTSLSSDANLTWSSNTLSVNGAFTTNEFQLGNSTTAGYVLTANSSGYGTWQSIPQLPAGSSGQTMRHDGSDWIASSFLFNDGSNIGIGISAGLGSRLVLKGSGNTNATSALNVTDNADASLLFVRDDGNIGIGTTAPGADLDVRGAAIFNEDASDSDFRAEGTSEENLFLIDASENKVGVGIASLGSNTATFQVSGSVYIDGDLEVTGEIDPISLTLLPQSTAPTGVRGKLYYDDANDELKIYTGSAYETLSTSGGTSLWDEGTGFIYYDAGSVGIGNNNPQYELDVTGAVRSGRDGTNGQFRIFQDNNNYEIIFNPPVTMGGNITYTLPEDDGTDGDVLTTDGSGVLSWSSSTSSGMPSGTQNYTLRYNSGSWESSDLLINDGTNIGIGLTNPRTNLHIYESTAQTVPGLFLQQAGSGDASGAYSAGSSTFTIGIDNDDNDNIEIANASGLSGTSYNDANTMMRIHTESGSEGIIDFNNQSRARAYRSSNQSISSGTWTRVEFNAETFDSKNEFSNYRFTAKEAGYYQVNARVEFDFTGINPDNENDYVSIAIYSDGSYYSYGNKLTIKGTAGAILRTNSAPVVSDIIYLDAGDYIEIHVFHNTGGLTGRDLVGESSKCYVSIHKSS